MIQNNNTRLILNVFLKNPTTEYGMREISRQAKVALPSTKNYLENLQKAHFILKVEKKPYPVYRTNRELIELKQMKKWYLCMELKEVVQFIEDKCMPDATILFGSAARGEDIENSDIDLCVIAKETDIDLKNWEKKFLRKITLHFVSNFNNLSVELKNNIINGVILQGYLKVF